MGQLLDLPLQCRNLLLGTSNKLGFYDNRKWEYASVVMADEARKIMGVYDDLLNGVSLKASFLKWGIDTEALKFDVTYNPDVSVSPWRTENLSDRQVSTQLLLLYSE